MNKLITSVAVAITASVTALGANVTTGVLGDIEENANVVTAVTLPTVTAAAAAEGNLTVTVTPVVVNGTTNTYTVAVAAPAEFDPSALETAIADLQAATNDLQSVKVDKEDGKGLVTLTEYATVKSTAESAVQTVAKAEGGAEELTVTQDGTGVTIDVDLSAYAKAADAYVHPTHTAYTNGFWKVTVDAEGHVSAASAVTKADVDAVVGLASASANGLLAAGDFAKFAALKTYAASVDETDITTLSEVIDAVQALIAALQPAE